jgi:alpha-1,3-rhamnosyl/mannosyltransferase
MKASDGTPLRIALNAVPLLSPATGIGQYTRQLALQLLQTPEVDTHLFYGWKWSDEVRAGAVPGIESWKRWVKRWVPAPYAISRFIQQAAFSAGARVQGPALYHEPAFLPFRFAGPTVVTAHDLAWIRFPHTHPAARVALLNRQFPLALENARHIITDATFIREEIIRHFGVKSDRITAIPLAARAGLRPRSPVECSPLLHGLDLQWRGFILCVGTLEPRKNLELLVRAYAGLAPQFRGRLPVVVVGGSGWLTSHLEAAMAPLIRAGQMRVLGYTDDETLSLLYSAARMFVYPSLYEGFGLPPLEAMSSGTPVIVSDAATLPEVVGDAAIQVKPEDEAALRAAIERIDGDEQEADRLRTAGLARARSFSWERCARETVAVYRMVLAKS